MDSDTVDRQIEDLDTGYEKPLDVVPHDQAISNASAKDLELGLQSDQIAWDKIQIIIYSIILFLIVSVVVVSIIFTLNKIKQNRENLVSSSTNSVSKTTNHLVYTNQMYEFSFEYPKSWKLVSKNQSWIQLIDTSNQDQIDILLFKTDTILKKSLFTAIGQELSTYCKQISSETTTYTCESNLENMLRYEPIKSRDVYFGNFSADHNETKVKLPIYIAEHNHRDIDTLVFLITNPELSTQTELIIQTLQNLH